MAIGGDIGATIDVSEVGNGLRTDVKVFSESNTRWVVEVKKEVQVEFDKQLKKEHVSFTLLGKIKGNHLMIKDDTKTFVDLSVDVLREYWQKPDLEFHGIEKYSNKKLSFFYCFHPTFKCFFIGDVVFLRDVVKDCL